MRADPTITVTLADGRDIKPTEFYKWLAYYCTGRDIRVHRDGVDTKLLRWAGKEHELRNPDPSIPCSLYMADEHLTYCQALVYDETGKYVGL